MFFSSVLLPERFRAEEDPGQAHHSEGQDNLKSSKQEPLSPAGETLLQAGSPLERYSFDCLIQSVQQTPNEEGVIGAMPDAAHQEHNRMLTVSQIEVFFRRVAKLRG